MGMDCYAYAVWGLKTTRAAVKKADVIEKVWVGRDGAPRTEFDADTGKANYHTTRTTPPELDEILHVGDYESREVVIPLTQASSDSHRGNSRAVLAKPEPSDVERDDFRAQMIKLGLWEQGEYGHWVFNYISI